MAEEKKVTPTVEETQVSSTVQAAWATRTELSPEQHGKLRSNRSLSLRLFLLSIDVILALSPLLFLGIAFAAIAYNGKPVQQDGRHEVWLSANKHYNITGGAGVIQAAQVGVSIFPLIFAAIVGRFMKAYAIHRAERGECLGRLEQLYGSTSVASAVQMTVALKGPGLLGIGIVVLWLLSPLGGQGVQRVLHTKTNYNSSISNIYYANTSGSAFAYKEHFSLGMKSSGVDAIISTALMSTQLVLGTGRDVWGNVKIPYYELLQNDASVLRDVEDGDLWVYPTDQAISSAMVGLLIHNIPTNNSADFYLTSSYINMTCEEPQRFVYQDSIDAEGNYFGNTTGYDNFLKWLPPLMLTNLSTISTTNTSWSQVLDVVVAPVNPADNTTERADGTDPLFIYAHATNPPQFIYASRPASRGNDPVTITAYKCSAQTVWVNSSIFCDELGACSVIRLKKIQNPNPGAIDPLFDQSSNDNGHGTPLEQLMRQVAGFGQGSSTGITNPLDFYLSGAPYAYLLDNAGTQPEYGNVTSLSLATRLGSLVNTFWLAGLEYSALAEPKTMNKTMLALSDPHDTTYEGTPLIGYDLIPATATLQQGTQVYEVSWPFCTIALVLCGALLFLGFMGIYYRQTNTYPDVLGFVSSLTRDNPHFVPPPRSEKLDGLEMARYFSDTKVRLVNVVDQDEAHRVTLRRYEQS